MTISELYPDLIVVDGLEAALTHAFAALGSPLVVRGFPEGTQFAVHVRVERGNRFSQVSIVTKKRLFSFDFWRDGVHLAHAQTPDIQETAKAIDKWVAMECSLNELAELSIVTLSRNARSYDQGTETEYLWNSYLRTISNDFPQLTSFVEAAAHAPQLRQLFPYTSMYRFCFSRCTGYPFTYDTPYVHPQKDGSYNVYSCNNDLLGNGDATTAVQLVIAHLPPNCGPAVRGTAETIEK